MPGGQDQCDPHPDGQPCSAPCVRARLWELRAEVGVGEQRQRVLRGRLGHQDVPWPRREEVGHVEAARAALHARDPLIQQDPLDQLRLRQVAPAGDLHELALRVLGLDAAGALARLGDRLLAVGARRRRAACRRRGRTAPPARSAGRRWDRRAARGQAPPWRLTSSTSLPRIEKARTDGASACSSEQIRCRLSGKPAGLVDVGLRRDRPRCGGASGRRRASPRPRQSASL